jgi:DNA-binding GntR family transcriptional regulator
LAEEARMKKSVASSGNRAVEQAPQRTLAEAAYNALRDAIQDGVLKPGQRIREMDISDWLNVSRTPVREALRHLQSEGMIEPKAGGLAVVSLDLRAVAELYDIRGSIEGTAAALAAQHADPTEIALLQTMIEAHRQWPSDARAQANHNKTFHAHLCRAAHNRFLLKVVQGLRDSLALLGPTTLALPARAEAAWAEHAGIVAAIAAHDPERAEAAARSHIRAGYIERVRAMAEGVRETAQDRFGDDPVPLLSPLVATPPK